jgi:hypothetical protein
MQNTQKHTQGPWRSNYPQITAQGDMALTVAVVLYREDNNARADSAAKTKGEAEANARLIAAAPELLAALKAMLNRYGDKTEHPFCDASISARAAISKAEGNV